MQAGGPDQLDVFCSQRISETAWSSASGLGDQLLSCLFIAVTAWAGNQILEKPRNWTEIVALRPRLDENHSDLTAIEASLLPRKSPHSQEHHVLGIAVFRLGQNPAQVLLMNENLDRKSVV